MNTFVRIYNSSLGRKLVVALTGICLCSFLIVHLAGNFLLFKQDGGASFDQYAEILPSILFIRVIEIGLFAILLAHIVTGTALWILNRSARPLKYEENNPRENSSFLSRTMFVSGSILFIFITVHMRSFWVTSRFHHEVYPSMYKTVAMAFSDPWYSGFYVFAMALLAFHLRHGFQSAFQTFGLKNKKYSLLIEAFGIFFWLLIPIGFASIPIYFLMQS